MKKLLYWFRNLNRPVLIRCIGMLPGWQPAYIFTDFHPPKASLAFLADQRGERTYPNQFANPLPVVVEALSNSKTIDDLKIQLPDW